VEIVAVEKLLTVTGVRRAFAGNGEHQVHYRHAGCEQGGVPLLALHGCPGSARQLVPLLTSLASTTRVIAPDLPGLGDSEPLTVAEPGISDFAAAMLDFCDEQRLASFDLYGTHTGAAVACELALLAPDRVGRIIVDGVACFDAETAAEYRSYYAQPFAPDLDGAYLQRAFQFCRDQLIFFPWYDRRADSRRSGGLMPPEAFHAWLVEVLKAGTTYHHAYRAAFAWDWADGLPRVTQPVLLTAAADDPLASMTCDAANLFVDGRWAPLPAGSDVDFAAARAALFRRHLAR